MNNKIPFFLSIEDNIVTLINSAFFDGYDTINFRRIEDNSIISFKTDSDKIKATLNEGEYRVYASNDSGDKTYSTTIYICDTVKKDILLRCAKSANIDTTNRIVLNAINKAVQNDDALLSLVHSQLDNTSDEYRAILNNLIQTYIKYLNHCSDINNDFLGTVNIDRIHNKISLDHSVGYVVQSNLIKKEKAVIYNPSDNDSELIIQNESLYQYDIYDTLNNVSKKYYMFIPQQDIEKLDWLDYKESKEKLTLIKDKEIQYPESYLSFNEYEKTLLSLEDEVNMDTPIFKKPTALVNGKSITVTLEDYDKIKSFIDKGFNLYIGMCMTDEINDILNRNILIEINDEEVTFDKRQYEIYNEDYYIYICDSNKNLLSHVSLVSFLNSAEQDYNEKIRQLDLYNYSKHLNPFIKSKAEKLYSIINEAYSTCESDEVSDSCDIVDNILNIIATKQSNYLILPYVINVLYQDKTIYGDYKIEFYDSPFYFKSKINTVTLPPAENVIYMIRSFAPRKEVEYNYRMSNKDQAVEVRLDRHNADCYLINGYSLTERKFSGFILIFFNNIGDIKISKYLTDIEVI